MKRILTAVVLVPLVLLILFRAPAWLFCAFILLVAVISTSEYLALVEGHGIVPFRRLTLAGVVALFLVASTTVVLLAYIRSEPNATSSNWEHIWNATQVVPVLFLALPFLFLVRGMTRADLRTTLPGAAASAFTFAYICFPFLVILFLRSTSSLGATLILYLLVTVWAGDIAAYYVGRSIGKRRLAPAISPKKSWEGAIASFIAGGVVGAMSLRYLETAHFLLQSTTSLPERTYHRFLPQGSIAPWVALVLSLGINIAAQLGDLVESMLKRGAGVKDSGTLLPGHGGVLDRIDALLFAAPVLWYYVFFHLIPVPF